MGESSEKVFIRTSSSIKSIEIPTSDSPLTTWMEIYRGVFPNISEDTSAVTIGEPLSLFIFLTDKSNIYDLQINDCWAFDEEHFERSLNKVRLNEVHLQGKNKLMSEWQRYIFPKDNMTLLYASFISFKFPDRDQIFVTCDIQIVGKKQVKIK